MPKCLWSGVCADSQRTLVPGPEYPCAMCSETYSQSGCPSKKEWNIAQINSIYVDIMVHYVWKINIYPWGWKFKGSTEPCLG